MQKILTWVRQHKIITTIIIGGIIILPIIIIHFLFKFHTGCYWIEADWSSGEVLGYFGDVLSFVGTVALGYIAISQTEKANNMNKGGFVHSCG